MSINIKNVFSPWRAGMKPATTGAGLTKRNGKSRLHNVWKVGAAVLCSTFFLSSCSEDIDDSNLYTFTGETILDYLANRDQFSSFKYIVVRSGLDSQMSAYGAYTCFAPTNSAITEYINNLYDDTQNVDNPHNGMTARSLEGLTDSLCLDIASYHIANTIKMGMNMSKNMTIRTFIGRDVNTTIDAATGMISINNEAHITKMDNEVENGVVHELDKVIPRSNELVSKEMLKYSDELSIFHEALEVTGLADTLKREKNESYVKVKNPYGFYIPEECKVGFTIFAETDDVFRAAGITNIEQLAAKANEIYAHCAEAYDNVQRTGWYDYARNHNITISTGNDYTNPWNCLNMFVRYHILKFSASYDKLFFSWNEDSRVTLYEYYETMLPYTLMKLEYTKSQGKRVINPWYLNSTLTDRIAELGSSAIKIEKKPGINIGNKNIQALNGYIHNIDDILAYDYDVPNGTLQERLRFDVTSFLWEMASNGLRGILDEEVGQSGEDGNLGGYYIPITPEFFQNLVIYNGNNTRLYYLPGRWDRNNSWSNYQADEFNCKGNYDFALRLPPVPDGTYELRIGYTANGNRGMLQFYLGENSSLGSMISLDIPLDMRHVPSAKYNADGTIETDEITGWCDWNKTEDMGIETDGTMRNLGYMRGPLYYYYGGNPNNKARTNREDLRRIITQRSFKQGEYWLRFKSVLPKDDATQFHLDYIELCPERIYNNTTYVEDMF